MFSFLRNTFFLIKDFLIFGSPLGLIQCMKLFIIFPPGVFIILGGKKVMANMKQ